MEHYVRACREKNQSRYNIKNNKRHLNYIGIHSSEGVEYLMMNSHQMKMKKRDFTQYQQGVRNMKMQEQISEEIKQIIFSNGKWINWQKMIKED